MGSFRCSKRWSMPSTPTERDGRLRSSASSALPRNSCVARPRAVPLVVVEARPVLRRSRRQTMARILVVYYSQSIVQLVDREVMREDPS